MATQYLDIEDVQRNYKKKFIRILHVKQEALYEE